MKLMVERRDWFTWMLTVFMLASFTIFEMYYWGKFVTTGICIIIVISAMVNNIFVAKLRPFHFFLVAIILLCAFTLLVTWSTDRTITKLSTLIQILMVYFMLNTFFEGKADVEFMISAIKWSGIILVVYAFVYYGGLNGITTALRNEERLQNTFTNVNTIGLSAAISCVIQFYQIIFKKNVWTNALFMIPSIIMIAATQSRKAVVILIVGAFLVVIAHNIGNRAFLKSLFKTIVGIVILILLFRMVLKLEIFSGLNERMEGFFSSITGVGKVDSSTAQRLLYRKIGWEYFLRNPILGIGFGSSGALLSQTAGFDTYTHNNFVEILLSGGIIGFLVFYGMYVYLLYNLIRYGKIDREGSSICIILLVLQLVMDYGMVSYYSKTLYFTLMMSFVEVLLIKKRLLSYKTDCSSYVMEKKTIRNH